jgi:hypothetical protein
MRRNSCSPTVLTIIDPTWNVLGAYLGVRDQTPSNNGLFYGTFPKETVLNPSNAARSIVSLSLQLVLVLPYYMYPVSQSYLTLLDLRISLE